MFDGKLYKGLYPNDIKQLRKDYKNYDDCEEYVQRHIEENRQLSESYIGRFSEDIGKLLLCECKQDGDYRLFIRRFSPSIEDRKEGWWDIFTISSDPSVMKEGFYFCIVDSFKIDKNGYVNMIVVPAHFLGTELNLYSHVWKTMDFRFIHPKTHVTSEAFSRQFCDIQHAAPLFMSEHKYNFENVSRRYYREGQAIGFYDYKHYIFWMFVEGRITFDEIEEMLDDLTSEEKYERELRNKIKNKDEEFEKQYPLFTMYYWREYENALNSITNPHYLDPIVYLESLANIYFKTWDKSEMDVARDIDKAEAVLKLREQRKAEKKAAKAAAKAAKKG